MTDVAWFHTGPRVFQFEILMTTFVELRVVAGRSRTGQVAIMPSYDGRC